MKAASQYFPKFIISWTINLGRDGNNLRRAKMKILTNLPDDRHKGSEVTHVYLRSLFFGRGETRWDKRTNKNSKLNIIKDD